MKKTDLLIEYAKNHSKEQIAWFASSLFGVDSKYPDDVVDGGKGSGNFGHKGRPGLRGGSGKGNGSGSSEGGSGGASYNAGQAVKGLGKVTRLQARVKADRDSLSRANAELEKARRPRSTRIGSCDKVAIAMPVGTIVKKDGKDYVKQHNGDWLGKDGVINRNDMGAQLENGSAELASVPKVPGWERATAFAKKRDAHGYPKGEMTDAVREYSEGSGVKTKVLPNGSGVTSIDGNDLLNKEGKCAPNTLGDNCMEVDGKLVLTPEREALHQQIVDKTFEGKQKRPEAQHPHITILGGGPASGKGGFTKKGNKYGIPDSETQVTIDPDEVKSQLPEYLLEQDKTKSAAYAHEESSALGKRIMQAAIANGYDYTLDGTGDNSAKTMMSKIQAARAIGEGAVVDGAYMTCPTEVALESSAERGRKTDRIVPPHIVEKTHSRVSHIFPQIASEFDHVELWDRTDGEPRLIASCKRGEKIKVHDEKAYKAFLAKDKEPYDPRTDLFDPRQNPYGKGTEPTAESGNGENQKKSTRASSRETENPQQPKSLKKNDVKKVNGVMRKALQNIGGSWDDSDGDSDLYTFGGKNPKNSDVAKAISNAIRESGYGTIRKGNQVFVQDPNNQYHNIEISIQKGSHPGEYYVTNMESL